MIEPSRREFLRSAVLAGGAAVGRHLSPLHGGYIDAPQAATAAPDAIGTLRARMGSLPITINRLTERLVLLSGPGGNVVVLHGSDGKLVVDSFMQPAWAQLKSTLEGLGGGGVRTVIDTHWHFDHVDNNAHFRETGAGVLAHVNTRTRLTQSHDLLGMHFAPAPAAGLPTDTFSDKRSLTMNGELVAVTHVAPAHTDSDVFVHYTRANVLHMGDVFHSGGYPFIDVSTGGNINGMIAGIDRALAMTNARTRIVAGHGPLSDHAGLLKYRRVIATIRDRVRELKRGKKTLAQVQAAKPSAQFDADWGKGMLSPDDFVALVYNTL